MNKKLLVVDDDPIIRRLFQRIFQNGDYQVTVAGNGEEALCSVEAEKPDLMILDVSMPLLDGYQVCSRLRDKVATRQIPILMLSGRSAPSDKLTGLSLGADDYVTKPFDLNEIKARVEALVRRSQSYLTSNPLTQLPGSPSIEKEVQKRIQNRAPLAFAYADLDSFKAYNDVYGYQKGDEVLLAVSSLLLESIQKWGDPTDFVGHIGGDDFVLVSDPEHMPRVAQNVASGFDRISAGFYLPEDQDNGYLETRNRAGNIERFPLLTLSIAVVTNQRRSLERYAEVVEVAAEMKRYVKSRPDKTCSRFAIDRRSDGCSPILRETPPSSPSLSLPSCAFLFTDLSSSTDLYKRVGDARAFSLVDAHFQFLKEKVERNGGRPLKTMGDALMAVFPRSSQAIQAAIEMQRDAGRLFKTFDVSLPLGIRIGVHEAPAILLNYHETPDYFGNTVNITAHLRNQSQGGDIVLSDVLYRNPEIQNLLADGPIRAESFTASLKGFPEVQLLWRLRA